MTLDARALKKLRELREASHDNDDFAEKFWEIVPQLLDAYEKLQAENKRLKFYEANYLAQESVEEDYD